MIRTLLRFLENIAPAEPVYAHCDIPCGVYDPHIAQLAAHTVLRMATLIEESKGDNHKIARLIAIKEEHAELAKHEVRILWGDYFKPDHLKQFPNLHELVWKVMQTGSAARQTADKQAAQNLLDAVNTIAEIFWKTKGVETTRVAAPYPTKAELVYPKL
ncbi:MAG: superoxide dismutase, Ni [Nanoarchaeota archaeon]|nr:superoxide dismutase, Ni [Nanoarchaeota archaeon]